MHADSTSSRPEGRAPDEPHELQADVLGEAQPLPGSPHATSPEPVPYGTLADPSTDFAGEAGVITPPEPAEDENRPGFLGERHRPHDAPDGRAAQDAGALPPGNEPPSS